jgi:hypothetical protein
MMAGRPQGFGEPTESYLASPGPTAFIIKLPDIEYQIFVFL